MALARALEAVAPDWIAVTGDITEHGSLDEWAMFRWAFRKLWPHVVLVPGNHDRGTDDVGRYMVEHTVAFFDAGPLRFIQLDTTSPANSVVWMAHGVLTPETVTAVIDVAKGAEHTQLPVLLLHHHLTPMPSDKLIEQMADSWGMPFMSALDHGRTLLIQLPERTLVLHGHKHQAVEVPTPMGPTVYNAGNTLEERRFRLFEIAAGRMASIQWYDFTHEDSRAHAELAARLARRRHGAGPGPMGL